MAVSNVELRVGATQAITALKNVNTQAQKFNQTVNGTNSKLKDANKNLPILGKGFFGAGASAKTAAAGFRTAGSALQSALLPILGITTAVAALGKAFGLLATQDFATAKVKTLGVDVDTLKPKLASLSNELSGQVSSLNLLSASYDVASAGFGEVAELSDVLKASQQGATGGFSDLATVADATTSVLNAYGLSSDKAAKLVDGFIQTQNDGKIVVDQYAQQIGRLAPIAAGAGVGIDELNAAISTVTATGVPVESTFAGLRQVIASIQKPTSEASKAAEKLGIDFSATALSTKGLGGVLEELVAKGGASEETLAQFFGSVEARTAILPLLNDQLVSFNKNLENQANAQGTAAQAAFTASNTIQGQLTRLGTAFTNLVTDGSEFGVIIREVFKVAAVTVEAFASAVKLVAAPIRAIIGAVTEVGKAIAQAIGIDATKFVFDLEQSWIAVKEGVTAFSDSVIKLGTDVGKIIGNMVSFIVTQFKKVVDFVNRNPVLKFIFGRAKLPKLNVESVVELKDKVEETAVASNKIVESNVTTGKTLDENTSKAATFKTAIKNAKNEADDLKEKFMEIGQGIEDGIVSSLTDAVMGTKTLAEAATSVLNNLKRQLIELAIQRAVSGIGNFFGNALGSLFTGAFGGGFKTMGGKSLTTASGTNIGKIGFMPSNPQFRGAREYGGSVSAGGAYVVGERGPEILQMGSRGGNIIPNNAIGGGGTTNNMITVNVDASGSSIQGNGSEADQLGGLIASVVQATIIDEQRAGGLLSR